MKSTVFKKIKNYQTALAIERITGKAPAVVRNMYWKKLVSPELKEATAEEAKIRLQTAIAILNELNLRNEFEEWKTKQPEAELPTPWSKLDGREKQETIIAAAEYAANSAS